MTALPALSISDDVYALIGPEGAEMARGAWQRCHSGQTTITCAICERPFTANSAEPGIVSVDSSEESALVKFIHERCGEGRVTEVEAFGVPAPHDVLTDVRVFPEQDLATVTWQPSGRAMAFGGRDYPDIYPTLWKALGAMSLKSVSEIGGRPDEQIPDLSGIYATLDEGNQLAFHYDGSTVTLPGRFQLELGSSVAVTFPPSTDFAGEFASCARTAGTIRAVLMTKEFSSLDREQLVALDRQRNLPKDALLIGRLPIRIGAAAGPPSSH